MHIRPSDINIIVDGYSFGDNEVFVFDAVNTLKDINYHDASIVENRGTEWLRMRSVKVIMRLKFCL